MQDMKNGKFEEGEVRHILYCECVCRGGKGREGDGGSSYPKGVCIYHCSTRMF